MEKEIFFCLPFAPGALRAPFLLRDTEFSSLLAGNGLKWLRGPGNGLKWLRKIKFSLEQAGLVNISIFNVMGQEVKKVLNNRRLNAGFHTKVWDGRDNQGRELPTGNYFYSIEAGDFRQTKKMILLK